MLSIGYLAPSAVPSVPRALVRGGGHSKIPTELVGLNGNLFLTVLEAGSQRSGSLHVRFCALPLTVSSLIGQRQNLLLRALSHRASPPLLSSPKPHCLKGSLSKSHRVGLRALKYEFWGNAIQFIAACFWNEE